ncbi:MAG: NnrS, partial [Ramlibacter sp.]|nr:NnrS [Ramlibacter sp.]
MSAVHEPPRRAPAGLALWQLGFRPFYLLAGAFGALSIALWGLQVAGWLGAPYLPGPMWHAHEMLFGFALPVIVGFLFTAGRNWTNQPTPTGWPLAALALLWLAGRVLVLTPWGWASALVNAAFPLAAAVILGIAFFKAGNRRNYFFVALLAALSLATFAVLLDALGAWA